MTAKSQFAQVSQGDSPYAWADSGRNGGVVQHRDGVSVACRPSPSLNRPRSLLEAKRSIQGNALNAALEADGHVGQIRLECVGLHLAHCGDVVRSRKSGGHLAHDTRPPSGGLSPRYIFRCLFDFARGMASLVSLVWLSFLGPPR